MRREQHDRRVAIPQGRFCSLYCRSQPHHHHKQTRCQSAKAIGPFTGSPGKGWFQRVWAVRSGQELAQSSPCPSNVPGHACPILGHCPANSGPSTGRRWIGSRPKAIRVGGPACDAAQVPQRRQAAALHALPRPRTAPSNSRSVWSAPACWRFPAATLRPEPCYPTPAFHKRPDGFLARGHLPGRGPGSSRAKGRGGTHASNRTRWKASVHRTRWNASLQLCLGTDRFAFG